MMEDLKASSREEALLAKIAGLDDPFADSIQPSSREEWFLNKIAEKTNSGGSGGGVLMVTDTDGTLDKTMGEIQDAYLAGKRVIISNGDSADCVIGIVPVRLGKGEYIGTVRTQTSQHIDSNFPEFVLVPKDYYVSDETEEAVRNAYPKNEDK